MQIVNRVQVIAPSGRILAHVSAPRAALLLANGASVQSRRGNRVCSIVIPAITAKVIGPPTPLSPASYSGQRYVGRSRVSSSGEQVVRCYQHSDRKILKDRDLFIGTLADVCKP